MERRVDHAGLHPLGDPGAQHRLSGAARDADPVAFGDAAHFGVVGMHLEPILRVPEIVLGAPRLRADVVLAEHPPGRQDQRESAVDPLAGRDVFRDLEPALAAHELTDVHGRRAGRMPGITGPLDAAKPVDRLEADAGKRGCEPCDLIHDLTGVCIVHGIAHGIGEELRDLPVGIAGLRLHHAPHPRNAPLGVGERAVLLQERGAGQEHVREFRRLVEEQVLHDDAFHRHQRGRDVLSIGIRLGDVLAFDVETLELAVEGRLEHVRNPQSRLRLQRHPPCSFEGGAYRVVRNVPVTREFVRKGAHVAGALDVVLAAQGIHADALASDVARGHGEIGDAHDHGRTLAVFGHAETIIDRAVTGRCKEARRGAHFGGRHAGGGLHRLGGVWLRRDEAAPLVEGVGFAALADELLLDESLGDDHVREAVDQRDVGAGAQLQMVVGAHVRGAYEIDASGIGHDEMRPFAQAALHLRGEHGMAVSRIRADHEDHVGLHHRIEILGSRRFAHGLAQAVAGRRVANPGAGVDVVVAEPGAHEFLHEIGFLVRAAR